MSRRPQSAPSEQPGQSSKSRRRRFAPLAVVAGVGATAALALSMTGTLSAFTAQITNSANTVTDGTLIMSEAGTGVGGAAVTCTSNDGTTANGANSGNNINNNTATCSTINKYGYTTNLVPGASSTASVTITNTGTANAGTFTLTPGACVQTGQITTGTTSSATDLCSKMQIVVTKTVGGTTTTVSPANATLASFATGGTGGVYSLGTVAANAGQPYTFNFTVTLPAGLGNTYQGQTVTQPLVWQFSAGS